MTAVIPFQCETCCIYVKGWALFLPHEMQNELYTYNKEARLVIKRASCQLTYEFLTH